MGNAEEFVGKWNQIEQDIKVLHRMSNEARQHYRDLENELDVLRIRQAYIDALKNNRSRDWAEGKMDLLGLDPAKHQEDARVKELIELFAN